MQGRAEYIMLLKNNIHNTWNKQKEISKTKHKQLHKPLDTLYKNIIEITKHEVHIRTIQMTNNNIKQG